MDMTCRICGHAHSGGCVSYLNRLVASLRAELARKGSNATLTAESNAPSNGFDKRAYQREYMRRRRAAKEA